MLSRRGTTLSEAMSASSRLLATASAAAMKKRSGMERAWQHTAPKDTPGKMYTLFTCPAAYSLPSTFTGGNQVPEPKMTRPRDQVYAFLAVTSAFDLGLDNAKMTGRLSLSLTIVSTTVCVKQSGHTPTAPTRTEGLMFSTKATKSFVLNEGSSTFAKAFCSLLCQLPFDPSAERQMRPSELVALIEDLGTPTSSSSRVMMPVLAEPHPWNRKVSCRSWASRSVRPGSRSRMAPSSPAPATAAVPWMSSL
mmetsp:Transcript_60595/g.167948  ORF Transcript_60595/g.167948 Transcript_60595/m.167948 type:complete len:250 (-) Transcript_60595:1169-1918(-)